MSRKTHTQTLQRACKITGSRWALVVDRKNGGWVIEAAYGESTEPDALNATPGVSEWLSDSLKSGRVRARKVDSGQWGVGKIYAFPFSEPGALVIVGADRLSQEDKQIFGLLGGTVRSALEGRPSPNGGGRRTPEAHQLIQAARLAAVGEMAAGVAHELNNPLTTIAGFAELILEAMPRNDSQRADMELILKEAQRAREVVRRLLNFSRKGEQIKIETDVNEMVGEVLAIVSHHAHTGGIDMHFASWNDLPTIFIDRNQIKQVVLNMVHNAIQSMPRGGELKLETLYELRDETDWIVINIMDTGEGIPEEHLGRLFEPFFTTKPTGIGTGLGLSISYRIVSDHGGFIDVKSRVGEGSRFAIWLPLREE